MSKLSDFLSENLVDGLESEVVISKRIPFPFKIKAISGDAYALYKKNAITLNAKTKQATFDTKKMTESIIINHTVDPDFRQAEDIEKAGCKTPEQYLYKTLLAGEIDTLFEKIQELSGLNIDINEAVEEAKN